MERKMSVTISGNVAHVINECDISHEREEMEEIATYPEHREHGKVSGVSMALQKIREVKASAREQELREQELRALELGIL